MVHATGLTVPKLVETIPNLVETVPKLVETVRIGLAATSRTLADEPYWGVVH
jgi:hypothetical protein